jgi:hypothetical protein
MLGRTRTVVVKNEKLALLAKKRPYVLGQDMCMLTNTVLLYLCHHNKEIPRVSTHNSVSPPKQTRVMKSREGRSWQF